MGLLQKALLLEKHFFANLSFAEICKKYAIATSAIFTQNENEFSISACFGFDAESILKSISTFDFWNGLFQNKNYIDAEAETLSPFFQLFSNELKETVSRVICKKIENENFCMLVFQNDELSNLEINHFFSDVSHLNETQNNFFDFSKIDFSRVLQNENTTLISLDFDKAIRLSLQNQNEKFSATLYAEIFAKLSETFLKPNAIFPSLENRANIVLFAHENFDLSLLQNHFAYFLKPILQNESANISLKKIGSAKAQNEIIQFIHS